MRTKTRKLIILIVIVLSIAAIDQFSKSWAYRTLSGGKIVTVISNFWDFQYTENYDIGFSIFTWIDSHISPFAKRIAVVLMQSAACAFAVYIFFTTQDIYSFPLAMIIGGAIGNIIDRITRGYVIDFIKWYSDALPQGRFNPWPYFNAADSAIVAGGFGLLLVYFIWDKKRGEKNE